MKVTIITENPKRIKEKRIKVEVGQGIIMITSPLIPLIIAIELTDSQAEVITSPRDMLKYLISDHH